MNPLLKKGQPLLNKVCNFTVQIHPFSHTNPKGRLETDSQTYRTDLCLPRRRRVGEGMHQEFGTSRCKLLHLEQINCKVLLYSTGSYIQFLMMSHNRKKSYKRMCVYVYICVYIYSITYIYICINESLCCTVEIGTIL